MQHDSNMTDPLHSTAPRKRWMGVLARSSADELTKRLESISPAPEYEYLRVPEIGMTMVRGRAGGDGQPFNLGEMTTTRCSVKLDSGMVGHGFVAGRNKAHAELAAIFDALLQSPVLGASLLSDVIAPLNHKQQQRREEQAAKTAATKVNFFTMVRGEDEG